MKRTLEPEEMGSEEEALDYDAMDHAGVNAHFCSDLLALLAPVAGTAHLCDLGTGTARIPIELCKRLESADVLAVDLSREMIRVAERNVHHAGLASRIFLHVEDAKAPSATANARVFDAVFSNSVVHHIPEPSAFLREAYRQVAAGGVLFIRDLARPETETEALRLAQLYSPAKDADLGSQRQHALLLASLHAALTVAEVQALVAPLGIPATSVLQTSDRHWTLAHRKTAP